jgi:hypothetical protein
MKLHLALADLEVDGEEATGLGDNSPFIVFPVSQSAPHCVAAENVRACYFSLLCLQQLFCICCLKFDFVY